VIDNLNGNVIFLFSLFLPFLVVAVMITWPEYGGGGNSPFPFFSSQLSGDRV